MELLLRFGAKVNRCTQGGSALHEACRHGQVDICRVLLEAGANIHSKNIYGIQPLFTAAQHGLCDILQLLAEKGQSCRPVHEFSFCLSGADINGQADVEVFLNVFSCLSGADINGEARDGASPLYEACKNGHVAAVEVLLSLKADANRSMKSGLLPLHVAVQNNHTRSETLGV